MAESGSATRMEGSPDLWSAVVTVVAAMADRLIENVETVIVGKRQQIEYVAVALLCGGHVLLDDVPGTGKTMLARSMAKSIGGVFKRIQCTPDLLPNDVTGVSIYDQRSGEFEFRPGPIFGNVLLVDEINRATPRTQSALLEAMQERQVTADGVTRALPDPFFVLATQNPVEFEGTFPLPEAQLDRFLLRLSLGYPGASEEAEMLTRLRAGHPIDAIGSVTEPAALKEAIEEATKIHLEASLEEYIVSVVTGTREHPDAALGASPRGSLALSQTSRALAAVRGRDYVLPDDIKEMAPMALAHRIVVRPESRLRGITAEAIVHGVLESTRLELVEGR